MPSPFAQSHWGDDQLNGPAVVGLAARALESHCGSPEFMPARFTADLFRAACNVPTTVDVRVVRDGRRVRSAECDVLQNGRTVTRATLVQYRRSSAPPGRQWTAPISHVQTPPPDDSILPYVGSDEAGWTRSPAAHQNDSRKRFYNDGIEVLAGEKNSPFVRAVMLAEATSLVTNLGTQGIGYINGDLTAAFSRLPVDDWIGVQADSHWAADGISGIDVSSDATTLGGVAQPGQSSGFISRVSLVQIQSPLLEHENTSSSSVWLSGPPTELQI